MRALIIFALCLCACKQPTSEPHKLAYSPTATPVLGTTGATSAIGLAIAGSHNVRSAYISNNTASNVWAVIADSATIPAGFTGMKGTLVLIPATSAVVLGTDFFGTDGLGFTTGVGIGITTTGSRAGGGTFTAGGTSFDITVNGT